MEQNNGIFSDIFIVHIKSDMSTKFKKNQTAFLKIISERLDFELEAIDGSCKQIFGFAYTSFLKNLH